MALIENSLRNSSAGGLPGGRACVIRPSLHSSTEPLLAPARTLEVCPDTANSQKTEPNCALNNPSGDSMSPENQKPFTSQGLPVPEATTSGMFGTIEHP